MKKEKPHYEVCPLCRHISAEVNFPKKQSEYQWGEVCLSCHILLGMALRDIATKKWKLDPKKECRGRF